MMQLAKTIFGWMPKEVVPPEAIAPEDAKVLMLKVLFILLSAADISTPPPKLPLHIFGQSSLIAPMSSNLPQLLKH
ncbi:hypothetical protein Fmac_032764 [Flemingia macrophylla]|uniref:Uncharacterized protein n=1 Tax=Flemingia macrophylla TaxID=520843 RepID=A0ABD1L696_9FABA